MDADKPNACEDHTGRQTDAGRKAGTGTGTHRHSDTDIQTHTHRHRQRCIGVKQQEHAKHT